MPRYVVASVTGYLNEGGGQGGGHGGARPGVSFQVYDCDYMRVVAIFRSESMYDLQRAPLSPSGWRPARLSHDEARAEARRRARALAFALNVLDEAA